METEAITLKQALESFNAQGITATYTVHAGVRSLLVDFAANFDLYSGQKTILAACPGGSVRSADTKKILGGVKGLEFANINHNDSAFPAYAGIGGVPLAAVYTGLFRDGSQILPDQKVEIAGFSKRVNWLVLYTSGTADQVRQIELIMKSLQLLQCDNKPLDIRVDVVIDPDEAQIKTDLGHLANYIERKRAETFKPVVVPRNGFGSATRSAVTRLISKLLEKKNGIAS
jgi:hypothetical protein